MARRLGDCVPYIGGGGEAKVLIPLLETLMNAEETEVRTATAQAVAKILQQVGDKVSVIKEYLELYRRLVVDDGAEVFYSRVSACQMAPAIYRACSYDAADQTVVRDAFAKLTIDELSIIRRAALKSFVEISQCADVEILTGEFLNILKQLASDDSSSVKIQAVEVIPGFATILHEHKASDIIVSDIMPLVIQATEDSSWRVKCAVAKEFGVFASIVPEENVGDLYRAGVALMSDEEPDVRQLIVPNLFVYFAHVGLEPFCTPLLPMLQLLFDDPIPEVRKSVAELSVDTAIVAGNETMASQLTDLVMKLVSDEDSSVRLRVLAKLTRVAEEVPNLLTKMTPTLKTLYGDSNWRVRRAVAQSMAAVCVSLGHEYFENHFLVEYLSLLKDGVSEVRIAIGETFPGMIEATTSEWFFTNIFAAVKTLVDADYLIRLSIIGGLRSMLKASSSMSETSQMEVLNLLLAYTKDSVPNIRLCAAQALNNICKDTSTDANKLALIKPVLANLQNDKDKDVKFFASTVITA